MCVCVYVCMYVYVYVCVYVYMCVYVYVCMCMCMCICIYVYMYVYVCICMYVCMYAYAWVYMYMYYRHFDCCYIMVIMHISTLLVYRYTAPTLRGSRSSLLSSDNLYMLYLYVHLSQLLKHMNFCEF